MSLWLPPLLDYQSKTCDHIDSVRSPGRSVLAVAPPGAGKSRTMLELAEREKNRGGRTLIKVHRTFLLEQIAEVFSNAGHEIGVIAPGYEENYDAPILIGSTQTLFARTVRRSKFKFPDVSLVINDEAHQQTGKQERALAYGAFSDGFVQEGYIGKGASLVGFTATPLMNQRIYTDLYQMVNYSELRKLKMHLPIQLFGPDEIDTAGLKTNNEGDYNEKELEPRVQAIFGSVYDEYCRLNPHRLPAILFAPSVDCSKWFCYQLSARGIPSAHIGSDCILMADSNGKVGVFASTKENRAELLRRSKDGEIKIICNRFVLREAIDMPWLYHAIFATVMGSTTTALQSVGRLQRFWDGYSVKILQDHGGFYWRHGSPNSDRYWTLGHTNKSYQKERVEKIIKGEVPEGMRCPKCSMWRTGGPVCPNPECNHASSQSVRVVRQLSGKLKHIKGSVFYAENMVDRAKKLWKSWLWRAGRSGMTVGGLVAACADDARRKGIDIDFDQMPWSPPQSNSMGWHQLAREYWPFLKGK